MAAYGRAADRSVRQSLFEEPYQFDFYQAVRLLEKIYPHEVSAGGSDDPDKESIRFKSEVSRKFPPSDISDIAQIKPDPAGKPRPSVQMTVSFMGIAGLAGPLPIPYTELILQLFRDRKGEDKTAFRDFLDIFNHRLIALLYRVVKTQRLAFDLDSSEEGRFTRCLFSLMGLGTKGLRNRMKLNQDRSLLYYTALLTQQPRSMCGLEAVLSDYFQVPIRGKQFIGKWYFLEEDQTSRIGVSGQNQILGVNTIIGTRVWDQNGKFELHLGPLEFKNFHDFLPIGTAFASLCNFTRFYVGIELDFDIVLTLKSEEAVRFRLGKPDGPKLGWTSWLTHEKSSSVIEYGRVRLSPDNKVKI